MKPVFKLLTSAVLLAVSSTALWAQETDNCSDGEYVCVDGPGSKFVNGVEVWRECWNYQMTRTCQKPFEENYCQALDEEPTCSRADSRCELTDLQGKCIQQVDRYQCSEAVSSDKPIVTINYTHTIVTSESNGQCQSFIDNNDCYVASVKCVEEGGTRIINGVSVFKDCWAEEREYACRADGVINSCLTLESAAGCSTLSDPVCIKEGANGCEQYRKTYRCVNAGQIEGDDIEVETPDSGPGFDKLSCDNATAGMSCSLTSRTCLDEGGTQIINGVEISTQCWEYQTEYACRQIVDESSCEALENLAACKEQSSKCIDRVGLRCYGYEKEYFCRGDSDFDGGEADKIESDVVIGGLEWSETCSPIESNPNCTILSTVCTEAGGTKEINGELITKDCWRYESTYVCGSLDPASDNCSTLEADPKCVRLETDCLMSDAAGKCLTTAHTYRCEERAETTTTEVICRPVECLEGLCGEQSSADKDFSYVLAVLETAREGAVYGDIDGNQFFKGDAARCTKKVLGFSCCDTKVQSGSSNATAFGKAMMFAGETTWEAIKYVGSPYVYDVLSASESTSGLLTALYGNATSGVYNPSLSFYGFGMTLQGSNLYFTFNPTAFALTVAVQIAMEYLQCEPSEQTLMLKKGQNLCHYVGTYCSKGETFGCIERSESYCCYNSRLARIIQEEGRAQLGKTWGSAKSPDCSGFTMEELEKLDFEAMDLSEFQEEITSQIELNKEAAQDRGTSHVDRLVSDNLGGYVAPNQGTSGVVNPDFTGQVTVPDTFKQLPKKSL